MFRLLKRRTGDSSVAEVMDNESVEALACRFDGTTKGYFEVWIVNLLMMVCTLGLFSPWAKARRRQYFYSNTWLGKHKLNYWATPKKSLPWAAGAALMVVAFLLALLFEPVLALAVVGLSVLLYPLARHHDLRSSAAATSYRARRFSYTGSLKDCYLRLIGWPAITALLAFVPLGHSMRSGWNYHYGNYNYGDEHLSADFDLADLWSLVLKTALSAVGSIAFVLVAAAGVLFAMGGETAIERFVTFSLAGQFQLAHGITLLFVLLSTVFPYAVWSAKSEHLLMANVGLEVGISLDSELNQSELTNLYLFNAIAIILTLGLAIPWAAIRVARYRASVTTMVCYADIDQLAGDRAAGLASLQLASVVAYAEDEDERSEELSSALDYGELDLPKAA